MRYFEYLGDHAETALYGVRFRAGEPTPVDPEKHPVLVRKLAGNSHFREVFAEPASVVEAVAPAPVLEEAPEPEQQAEPIADAPVEAATPKRRGRPPKAK